MPCLRMKDSGNPRGQRRPSPKLITMFSVCPGALESRRVGPRSSIRLSRHISTVSPPRPLRLPAFCPVHSPRSGTGASVPLGPALRVLWGAEGRRRGGACHRPGSCQTSLSEPGATKGCWLASNSAQCRVAFVWLDRGSHVRHHG